MPENWLGRLPVCDLGAFPDLSQLPYLEAGAMNTPILQNHDK